MRQRAHDKTTFTGITYDSTRIVKYTDKAYISQLMHILYFVTIVTIALKKLFVFVNSQIILPSTELLTAINRCDRIIESVSGTQEPDQFNPCKIFGKKERKKYDFFPHKKILGLTLHRNYNFRALEAPCVVPKGTRLIVHSLLLKVS